MKKQSYEQYPETYLKLLHLIRTFAAESDSDRLPSEENMAAQLGVSRVKVRDELSKLEAAGYVTRKRGVGTLVNRYVLQEAARLRLAHPEDTLAQLAEQCDPPVTKSALNHRLRKLVELGRAEH